MSEWDRRELCPDGTCVGVIGPDGQCGVCGRASDLGPRASAGDADEDDDRAGIEAEASDSDSGSDSGSDAGGSPKPEARGPAVAAEGGDEWAQRQLCPDGACVGVIGDEGKCTVCGRTAA